MTELAKLGGGHQVIKAASDGTCYTWVYFSQKGDAETGRAEYQALGFEVSEVSLGDYRGAEFYFQVKW